LLGDGPKTRHACATRSCKLDWALMLISAAVTPIALTLRKVKLGASDELKQVADK
jgi:hypothetical protein